MPTQTKNIITCESIEKELRHLNTADIKATLTMCCIMALFFLPLTVGAVYVIGSLHKSIWIKIVLSLATGGLTSSPVWINLIGLLSALSERRQLLRGNFAIITREVSYKSEDMLYRHTEERLHFSDFDAIEVAHTIYQLTSAGDTFYIVHFKGKKTIQLLYAAKMYELQ